MSSLLRALSQMPLVVGAKEHDEPGGMLEIGGNGIRQNAQHMRQRRPSRQLPGFWKGFEEAMVYAIASDLDKLPRNNALSPCRRW